MSLTIVVPAHNEEHRIDRTLTAYRSGFAEPNVRFVVALDGGDDGTPTVVAAHTALDPRVELAVFPKLGKGGVLMEAFRRCGTDWVAFVDADCATPPSELARLVDVARDRDGAIASRRHPASFTPARRERGRGLTSAGFALGVRALFRLPYSDTQCGAKVLRREALELVLPYLSSRDFLFDVDLLLVAERLGFDIVEMPTIWIDQPGSRLKPSRDVAGMLASALRLWLHHRVLPVGPAAAPKVAMLDESRESVDAAA